MFIGKHYINGKFVSEPGIKMGNGFADINPANEETLGCFPDAGEEIVHDAVSAARAAFKSWKLVSRVQRGDLFKTLIQLVEKNHDKLVEVISLETGKSLNESHAEVIETIHMLQVVVGAGRQACGDIYASELSTKDAYVIRKPKGVVAVIAPWNFCLAIGSAWQAAPAIIEGNCVVHKPSQLTPMIAQIMAELYHEAGFPEGVYNLVHGQDNTGKLLVENDVDCVLFTGSSEVGKLIRKHCADTWHKSCLCEMGSKSAVAVFADGDLDLALDACIASAFKLSGQRCVSAGRILVERSIFDEFSNKFTERASKLLPGDPFDKNPSYFGPLITREAMERVIKYNKLVEEDPDAKILVRPRGLSRSGYYLTPCVYHVEWNNTKKYLMEEVFGPHVALIPFNDIDDAIRIYNDTDYGLALGVITDNFRKMGRMRDECDAGMIYLNGGSIGAESALPFGGVKRSGSGGASAAATYKAVTHEVAVTLNYEKGKITWAQGLK